MGTSENQDSASFKGVTISGTFKDLESHREIITKALQKHELFPVRMEDYVVDPDDDIISSSLKMVIKGSHDQRRAHLQSGIVDQSYQLLVDDHRPQATHGSQGVCDDKSIAGVQGGVSQPHQIHHTCSGAEFLHGLYVLWGPRLHHGERAQ